MQVIDYDKYIVDDDRVKFFVKSQREPAPLAGHGDEDFGFQVIKNSIRQVFTDLIVAPGELALFVVILLLLMSATAPHLFAKFMPTGDVGYAKLTVASLFYINFD
jgi:hypothetical protein